MKVSKQIMSLPRKDRLIATTMQAMASSVICHPELMVVTYTFVDFSTITARVYFSNATYFLSE